MTRKIAAALVVGLLVGMLIGTLLPVVQAGGRRSSDRRSLEQRVARLERRTQHLSLEGDIGPDHVRTTGCASGDGALWRTLDGITTKLAC